MVDDRYLIKLIKVRANKSELNIMRVYDDRHEHNAMTTENSHGNQNQFVMDYIKS